MTVGVKQGVVDAISEANNEYGGRYQTRLTAPVVAGQTIWPVESLYEWPTAGTFVAGGQIYTYSSRSLTALEGIAYTDGADSFTGAARDLPQELVVTDYTRARTGLDLLRRALLVDYAEGSDLSALGRNLGVLRLPTIPDDDLFREIVKALAYNPRGTIYGIELFLDAAVGAGNYEIIEDLIEEPNKVKINIFGVVSTLDFSGKTFLTGAEYQAAASATTVPIANPVVTDGTVHSVRLKDEDHTSDFRTALPSVETLVEYIGDGGTQLWYYQGPSEGVDVVQLGAGPEDGSIEITDSSGVASARYVHPTRIQPESDVRFGFVSYVDSASGLGSLARQWGGQLYDGAFVVAWGVINVSGTSLYQLGLSVNDSLVSVATTLEKDRFYAIEIRKFGTSHVQLFVDGALVAEEPYATFTPATTNTTLIFGANRSILTNIIGRVKQASYKVVTHTDYWAARGSGGDVLAAAPQTLDTNDPIFAAPDVGKRVQISNATASRGRNNGVFEVDTVSTAEELVLRGYLKPNGFVESVPGTVFNAEDREFLFPDDLGKIIHIPSGPNAGDRVITALLDADTGADLDSFATDFPVRTDTAVCGAPAFITETGISWRLNPNFDDEASIEWVVSNMGAEAAQVITLAQSLPTLATPVGSITRVLAVLYSEVLSAQLLEDRTVVNDLVAAPDTYRYYPFYLADPGGFIRRYIDLITAAGVIPELTGV